MADNELNVPKEEKSTEVEAAIQDMTSGARIQNPDDVIGLCSECKNPQPPGMMERNVFAAEGLPPSCRYCGGVVIVTYAELQGDALNARLDAARGIGNGRPN